MAAPADLAARGPQPRPGILDIRPYKGGDSAIAGVAKPVKLASNENALGASPKAKAAFIAAAERLNIYPDGDARLLREAIGEAHGLDPARIVCGAGSDELLQILARAYAGPGDEIVFSAHGFLVYPLAAMQVGARPVAVPERALTADVDAILSRVGPKTRIVFLANPNNPTGTLLSQAEVARLHQGLPERVLLVLDAAYAELVDSAAYDPGVALAGKTANVVMTRTLSKAYGLAALRIGWAYGPAAVIDVVHRMRGPFNVAAPAIAAGVAAICDQDFLAASRRHNTAERAKMTAVAEELGLLAAPSEGNFILLRFPDAEGKRAPDADAFLRQRGLILRRLEPYGLGDCLRLTIGTTEQNGLVAAALGDFMADA